MAKVKEEEVKPAEVSGPKLTPVAELRKKQQEEYPHKAISGGRVFDPVSGKCRFPKELRK